VAPVSQEAVVENGDADEDEAITATIHQTSRPDRTAGSPIGRPLVSAVKCPAGHPNPPRAERCRVCPRHVPPQQETQIERPVLGVLRLSTGEDILLDRDVLLGREPRSARETADKPHELRLPSPGKDISRNHLEVRLLGWRVVAIDLGSTNGTTVRPPDGPAESLPPGGTRVIEPGTEVSLAGVVSFIFEATA
jgi:FHA domain